MKEGRGRKVLERARWRRGQVLEFFPFDSHLCPSDISEFLFSSSSIVVPFEAHSGSLFLLKTDSSGETDLYFSSRCDFFEEK